MLNISAESHQDAAIQLSNYLKSHGWSPVACKPWNRFDPYFSHWLVIPSTDWPAYRYGKYFFIGNEGANEIVCGLTVEKGLGQDYLMAFPVPKARPLIMGDDWTWHLLADDLRSGTFKLLFDRTAAGLTTAMSIVITAGPVDDPEEIYDPDSLVKWDRAEFSYDGNSLTSGESKINEGCLKEVAEAVDFFQLGETLASIPKSDWMWANFDINMKTSLTHNTQVKSEESIQSLWNNRLVHLDRWFC